jgi:hypothetical protein
LSILQLPYGTAATVPAALAIAEATVLVEPFKYALLALGFAEVENHRLGNPSILQHA